jgi:hypothetical protein
MNKYLEKIAAIHIKPSHKGLLHKKLDLAEGAKIGNDTLEAKKKEAERNGDTKLEKEIVFAQNAKKWNHKR